MGLFGSLFGQSFDLLGLLVYLGEFRRASRSIDIHKRILPLGELIMTAIILLLALAAHADSTIQPREKVRSVADEIAPSVKPGTGISRDCESKVYAEVDECLLSWTPAPGKTPTFTDWRGQRQVLLDELDVIETALDAGTETAAQRRRFMKIILKLNGWNRRP